MERERCYGGAADSDGETAPAGAQGVPTRRRGKGWHSQVVKLIADRMIGEKGSRGTET